MNVGDNVLYRGRRYVLHGFTHASSMEQHAVIEDGATGALLTVPLDEIELVRSDA